MILVLIKIFRNKNGRKLTNRRLQDCEADWRRCLWRGVFSHVKHHIRNSCYKKNRKERKLFNLNQREIFALRD